MRAGKIEGVTTPNQNQGTSPWYFCCIFISHFYRGYKYYFFSLKFSYEHSEIPTNFCFLDLLHFQNNECKKNLEIREGSQEQWKHTSTPYIFFFLSLDCSYEHSERFPTIFFDALLVFVQYWKQKNLQMSSTSLDFRGNSQILGIDIKFSRAPTFNVHQIIACPLHHFIATPSPNAIIWNAR